MIAPFCLDESVNSVRVTRYAWNTGLRENAESYILASKAGLSLVADNCTLVSGCDGQLLAHDECFIAKPAISVSGRGCHDGGALPAVVANQRVGWVVNWRERETAMAVTRAMFFE